MLQFGIKENNRYAIKSRVFCSKKKSTLFHKVIVNYVILKKIECPKTQKKMWPDKNVSFRSP